LKAEARSGALKTSRALKDEICLSEPHYSSLSKSAPSPPTRRDDLKASSEDAARSADGPAAADKYEHMKDLKRRDPEVYEWLNRPRPETLSKAELALLKRVESMLPSRTMEEIRSAVGLSRRGLERLMRTGGVERDYAAIAKRRRAYSMRGGMRVRALYSLPPERLREYDRARNATPKRRARSRAADRRRNREAILSWLGGACLCGYDHAPSLVCATRSGSVHPMSGFLRNPRRCKNGLRWYRLWCPKCWAALEAVLVERWTPGMARTKNGPLPESRTGPGAHTAPFPNPRRREGRIEG